MTTYQVRADLQTPANIANRRALKAWREGRQLSAARYQHPTLSPEQARLLETAPAARVQTPAERGAWILARQRQLRAKGIALGDANAQAAEESRQGLGEFDPELLEQLTTAIEAIMIEHPTLTKIEAARLAIAALLGGDVDAGDVNALSELERQPGRNIIERAMSAVRARPGGRRLSFDEAHVRACQMVARLRGAA